MPDSTDAAMAGTAARAQRATTAAALAARDEAWRAFIDHTQACDTCRNTGLDCELAAELKQIWRAARKAAA